MLRTTSPGTTGIRLCVALLTLSFSSLFLSVPTDCRAQDVNVLLFNLSPEKSHSIRKNTVFLGTTNSSTAGVVRFSDQPVAGDRYAITETGAAVQPPAAPSGLAATGDDSGCAVLQWISSAEPDVDYYRVYYGTRSVEGGEASQYDDSLDVSGDTAATVCGLTDGTWYFSVRAHNTAGLLSVLSPETSASVSNGNTQPPSPPMLLAASEGEPGCVDVVWLPDGSPEVTGYVVDYGRQSSGGGAGSYEYSVDAGNVSSTSICDLTEGTWYFAVRSRNFAGMLSAYSSEQSAYVTPTPVYITAFSAEAERGGVKLAWSIYADEVVEGFSVRRARDGDTSEMVLNEGHLLETFRSSWTDENVEPSTTYIYSLVVVGENGAEYRSPPARVTTPAWEILLEQNVPNPFNPTTSISFVVPATARTRLTVYDVSGSLVKKLVDEVMDAGRRTVVWDGTNAAGLTVGSGTYFYRLVTGNKSTTRKMLLLK